MSDSPPDPPAVAVPKADANGQLIVALAIVAVLGLLGLALIVAALVTQDWSSAPAIIGTIVGALATALNAPSGIGNVLRASAAAQPQSPPAP